MYGTTEVALAVTAAGITEAVGPNMNASMPSRSARVQSEAAVPNAALIIAAFVVEGATSDKVVSIVAGPLDEASSDRAVSSAAEVRREGFADTVFSDVAGSRVRSAVSDVIFTGVSPGFGVSETVAIVVVDEEVFAVSSADATG